MPILRSCVLVVVARDLKGIWRGQTWTQAAWTKPFHKRRHGRCATIINGTTCLKYGGAIHQKRRQSRAQNPRRYNRNGVRTRRERGTTPPKTCPAEQQHGMQPGHAVSQTGLTPSRSAIQEETGEDLRKRQGNATDRLCVFACLYRRCFYPKMKKRCAEDFYEVSYQQTMIQTARMPLKQQYFRQLYHYYSCWNLLP